MREGETVQNSSHSIDGGCIYSQISFLGFPNFSEFSALRALSKMIIDILVTGPDSSRVFSLIRSTTGTFVIPFRVLS